MATKLDLHNTRECIDDGITGTRRDRENFQRLLKDIEKGEIGTVVVKDLSRLARDHIQADTLIEKVFPEYDVRLIAPGDGVDTPKGEDDVAPLYTQERFTYFDRYADGDPYENEEYAAHFSTVLRALRECCKLRITFVGHRGGVRSALCTAYKLEYSEKDDKFRLLASGGRLSLTINLARITQCELAELFSEREKMPAAAAHGDARAAALLAS